MLVLDIDGTLLKSNFKIDRTTKEAIEYVKEKGVYVTLATGRNFPSAQKIAKALKLDSILITHNGAFVASSVDEPFYEQRMSAENVLKVVQILEKYDAHIRLLHERYSIGNQVQQKSQLVAKMTMGIGDPLFYPVTFTEQLSDHLKEKPMTVPKIDVQFFDNEERANAFKELTERIEEIRITSSTRCAFEIIDKSVSKAKALNILARHLGVSRKEIVAVGDYTNDLEMIHHAGLGVAMGNSPNELKHAADWVTRSNNQNGVSYMVREVFRKQMKLQIEEPLEY
ncbi:Cof-type HAD-IIB family hydrolase [Alkalihalobacillus sp. AL-G]|uniref:Cof-type HAD-IIB family hydrolase n=1 Tax=Alkalihalobacillus sp. AL-G TaxID=2926399 RepID=UPI00272D74BE|nr:Cof-type HAD-IIB family hydrolase [Alkalihalobacillus sp. AL-G]WLD94052.1 Cof-type HAD-IIB family hydrolase [Alkalihalobacillus sp. AL-G]